ncbi:cytochrome b/b6 domain-containing protein [Rheinheimera texasensis]|uniref:cytochrome b/b6 domain-containing protein n=1 Tax=Rheinheimera texasensis TaxID=306205 RepID=UPI00056A69F2|nr:cytochrome b/b6 domain-containing protein [Rheinheimera texasensis]
MQQIQSALTPVFDLAVRLFHWLQVLLLGGLWYSAEQEWYGIHQLLAYTLASLLGARLIWGLIGSDTARFRHFVPGFRQLRHYLATKTPAVGHNPLSALMILALILLVALQFFSGLMTTDEVMTEGPLYSLVPDWLSSLAGSWHELGFNLLLGLVALHVLAAVLHQWRGDRVISAMWHGRKVLPANTPAPQLLNSFKYLLLALILFCGLMGWQGSALWPQVLTDLQTIGVL